MKNTRKEDGSNNKIHNPVAKNLREFNKATVEVDKKKRDKTGYKKHKEDYNA